MRLFYMPHQMVLASETLRTELTEEIPHSGVHHQMAPNVLIGEEPSVADVALELLLVWVLHCPAAGVDLQMVQDILFRFERVETNLTL